MEGVTPMEGVTRGGPSSSPSPSDATDTAVGSDKRGRNKWMPDRC